MYIHVKTFLVLIVSTLTLLLSSSASYAEGAIRILLVEATSENDAHVDDCVRTGLDNVKKAFESEKEKVGIDRSRRFELRPSEWEQVPIGLSEKADKLVFTKSIQKDHAGLRELEEDFKKASLEADSDDALFVLLVYSQNTETDKKAEEKGGNKAGKTKKAKIVKAPKEAEENEDAKASEVADEKKDNKKSEVADGKKVAKTPENAASEKIDAGSAEFQTTLLNALKIKEHRLIVLLVDSCGAAYEKTPGASTLLVQPTSLDRSKMTPKEQGYLKRFLQTAMGEIALFSTEKGETAWGGDGTRFTTALIRLAANGLYLENELEPDAFARLLSVELERECLRFSERRLVDLHRQTLTKLTPEGFVEVRSVSARERSDELEEDDEERYRHLVESGEFKLEKTKAVRIGGNSVPRF